MMKMKNKLNDLSVLVEKALRDYPQTRDSDTKLIYCVMRMCGVSRDESFTSVMLKLLNNELPAFASITRAKRKVVELNPELNCSEKVREFRQEQQEAYKDFSRG